MRRGHAEEHIRVAYRVKLGGAGNIFFDDLFYRAGERRSVLSVSLFMVREVFVRRVYEPESVVDAAKFTGAVVGEFFWHDPAVFLGDLKPVF